MSAFHDNALIGASGQQGYKISRSVRLRSSASAYFNRTPASAGNRTTWTFSTWLKRGQLSNYMWLLSGYISAGIVDGLRFQSDNSVDWIYNGGRILATSQLFRDPAAWYHLVFTWDTTQSTSANRARIYVNGVQVTAFSTASYPAQNSTSGINNATVQRIGVTSDTINSEVFDGYLTEINFIDGQALTPSSFGETNAVTGVWQPKKYGGTYGTNGFYLNFSDNSGATATTIGKDNSGNGNNWTPNNISVTAGTTYDSMLDVPTPYADGGNGRGNYAVVNPLNTHSVITVSGANLNTTYAGGAYQAYGTGTVGITTGKFYWEITVNTIGATGVGIFQAAGRVLGTEGTNNTFNSASSYIYFLDGKKYNGSDVGVAYGATYTTGDIIGVAFDADNGTLTFYKNNSSQGTAYTGLTATPYLPSFTCYSGSNLSFNFGQRPFAYTPPTGFKALNTQNLPTPTIVEGNAYFDVVTRNGTGSAVSVSSLSFQPDSILTKLRNTAYNWYWADAVRGVSKTLSTDTTAAEQTPSPALFTSFNSDGYTLGTNTGSNGSTYTYVDYVWNAGGSTVTNTSGSISAQVRANPTAGFSVVTYTGTGANATVGHGLGVAPSMVIVKPRSTTGNWSIWHTKLTSGAYALFFNTDAQGSYPTIWNSTIPTSTVFSIGTASGTNVNGQTQVAYCFAAVAGYSAFGSYTGNGSTDGPFVYTGFRPRFVMTKRTDTTSNWYIQDTSRSSYNLQKATLFAESSAAEAADGGLDFLSNGFKLRNTDSSENASGGTYIYMAFAENPLKLSLAR
jgi:hypothetical protein